MAEPQPFIAYRIHDEVSRMTLATAPIDREWMDGASSRFPYRCLPLNIANQNGWILKNPTAFRCYWYGGAMPNDVEVRFDGPVDNCVLSHFGVGTITFSLPFMFRTPPGINLWAKGAANWIKDGIQPLEGIIETDWATSTFTMNWKLTRPNEWVHFEVDEPICCLVPIPRGLCESLDPKIVPLKSDAELFAKYKAWEASRSGFLQGLKTHDPETVKRGWQKDYFQGKLAEGGAFDGHQTRLSIKEFEAGG